MNYRAANIPKGKPPPCELAEAIAYEAGIIRDYKGLPVIPGGGKGLQEQCQNDHTVNEPE